ncbi:MAG: hypothetical protein IJ192_12080 [Clostridia bacterium]|nr:hypothetical protein [Clostridia bacterium]
MMDAKQFFWVVILTFIMVGVYWSLLIIPIILTGANLYFLIKTPKNNKEKGIAVFFAGSAVVFGFSECYFLGCCLKIAFTDWQNSVVIGQIHTPASTEHLMTIYAFAFLGALGFLLLFVADVRKTPPLLFVLYIALIYFGVIVSFLWAIQTSDKGLEYSIFDLKFKFHAYILYSFDLCIIAASLIKAKIIQYNEACKNELRVTNPKLKFLNDRLLKSTTFPFYAFLLLWPVMGIVISLLVLCGQDYDSIIKAWTETSEWVLSIHQSPPPVEPNNGHYLCTVAAGGHKKTVKPLREGQRHGHRVIVNRQLCIANAFEQVLEEKTPRFHKAVRGFYDKYGLPVAKLIKKPLTADIVYFIMKPLEWIFIIVLYLTDKDPEKRIAVQYLPQKDKENLLKYIENIQ